MIAIAIINVISLAHKMGCTLIVSITASMAFTRCEQTTYAVLVNVMLLLNPKNYNTET